MSKLACLGAWLLAPFEPSINSVENTCSLLGLSQANVLFIHGYDLVRAVLIEPQAILITSNTASAECTHCVIQTKVSSTSVPGKFDYRVSCIIDLSGDEVNTAITAANDEEAIEMVRQKQC